MTIVNKIKYEKKKIRNGKKAVKRERYGTVLIHTCCYLFEVFGYDWIGRIHNNNNNNKMKKKSSLSFVHVSWRWPFSTMFTYIPCTPYSIHSTHILHILIFKFSLWLDFTEKKKRKKNERESGFFTYSTYLLDF